MLALVAGLASAAIDGFATSSLRAREGPGSAALVDRGAEAAANLRRADHGARQEALHSSLPTLHLAGWDKGGPLVQFGVLKRHHAPIPPHVPAATAIRAKHVLLSQLDFAARLAAVKSGALSSRTTSIPPPLHI